MHKASQDMLPLAIQNTFVKHNENDHHTRQANKFKQIYARTSMKARALSIVGVKLWNALSCEMRDNRSFTKFKQQSRTYFLNSYNL